MREANLPTPRFKKLTVQGGEKPRLHFVRVAQLVALRGPYVERLLRQIARVGLGAGQAEGKLIQRLVVASHQTFKIPGRSHIATSLLRGTSAAIVPAAIRRDTLEGAGQRFERKKTVVRELLIPCCIPFE